MTHAQTHLLAKARAGQPITPDDVVPTITSRDELAAYRDGLKLRGALTADAMQAVQRRAKQMGWWK